MNKFITRESDLVYESEQYKIYSKDARHGTYQPAIMLDIIDIGLDGLMEWENGGLKYKKDLESIFNSMKQKMDLMLKEFKEKE